MIATASSGRGFSALSSEQNHDWGDNVSKYNKAILRERVYSYHTAMQRGQSREVAERRDQIAFRHRPVLEELHLDMGLLSIQLLQLFLIPILLN